MHVRSLDTERLEMDITEREGIRKNVEKWYMKMIV